MVASACALACACACALPGAAASVVAGACAGACLSLCLLLLMSVRIYDKRYSDHKTCPISGQGFLGDLPLPVQKARES